jgi:hypothetical protein
MNSVERAGVFFASLWARGLHCLGESATVAKQRSAQVRDAPCSRHKRLIHLL